MAGARPHRSASAKYVLMLSRSFRLRAIWRSVNWATLTGSAGIEIVGKWSRIDTKITLMVRTMLLAEALEVSTPDFGFVAADLGRGQNRENQPECGKSWQASTRFQDSAGHGPAPALKLKNYFCAEASPLRTSLRIPFLSDKQSDRLDVCFDPCSSLHVC